MVMDGCAGGTISCTWKAPPALTWRNPSCFSPHAHAVYVLTARGGSVCNEESAKQEVQVIMSDRRVFFDYFSAFCCKNTHIHTSSCACMEIQTKLWSMCALFSCRRDLEGTKITFITNTAKAKVGLAGLVHVKTAYSTRKKPFWTKIHHRTLRE